jgi:hypothetical protein
MKVSDNANVKEHRIKVELLNITRAYLFSKK